ncbi:glycogen debranching protein GlgX [Desulfopila sp. IMCC35008]|uniref:glycogen debranching protein GlgX n=1 Tax=Desulfopila sp. IMCC35008 TaxID=2653858 RepID=UPI0013D62A90|nr:glycogen debranching protein GlgX [Desulfopila sp. IMCC35008]
MSKEKLPCPIKRGHPLPLGVTDHQEGLNFALFSRHADQVILVIEWPEKTGIRSFHSHEIPLHPEHNRTGDIWHILLETCDMDITYGYRIYVQDKTSEPGTISAPQSILIDPFSQSLTPRKWGEAADYGRRPCCRIARDTFNWREDRPLKISLSDTVIYELHVRGFTRQDTQLTSSPGTYKALTEKIPYLQELGITAVELMPVTEFDENDNVFRNPHTGETLKNYWGYNPVSFFALKSGYAHDPSNHINEFKEMVYSFHQAGIEVFLDIVYNHTGEGGYDGTTSSFRGIDNSIYYLLDPTNREYLNFSGCGNTLNCNHPVVRNLIIESLRYWVTVMHIDGFRFDLASILGRDKTGNVLSNPPMIELIAEDPVLRDTKIIAEAWDAAGLYQVGSFSTDSRWGEWNGRFRDDVRAFMAGHNDTVTKLATRMAGSSDLYQASQRSPLSSINLLTSHDGFTLYDLVSYNIKHNLDNGENNRDGDNHNLSWNSGHEGIPAPTKVEQLRHRRIRSMFTILMLSQGIPMITAGDELGRSQRGNNNAWCQDNETSWLDWRLLEKNAEQLSFFRFVINLRRKHQLFRRDDFFHLGRKNDNGIQKQEISWQYLIPGQQNWEKETRGLGVLLHGETDDSFRDDDFFIMINGHKERSLSFTLPPVPGKDTNGLWHLIINTAGTTLPDILPAEEKNSLKSQTRYTVAPFGVTVLQSVSIPAPTSLRG